MGNACVMQREFGCALLRLFQLDVDLQDVAQHLSGAMVCTKRWVLR